jgi:tetratricopeptide (TPR) repeat protein
LWKHNQVDAGAAEFEKALKLDPGNVHTEYFLGRIAYAQGDTGRAIQFYEAIVASGTPLYDTLQQLGPAYFKNGNLPKALETTQEALRQTPWDGALHFQLGKIYQRMGQREESQREFESSERLKQADQATIQKLLSLSMAAQAKQCSSCVMRC